MQDSTLSMRLVRGDSTHHSFCLGTSIPRAIFRVGSALECNWRVTAPGVAPHHFMLLWNGRTLTVIDVGAGDLWVDNQAFRLSAVVNFGQISFGSAIISIEQVIRVTPLEQDYDTLVCPPPFGSDTEPQ